MNSTDITLALSVSGRPTRTWPPKLREASFADYDQIAALEARNGLAARPYEDWVALWKDNPAYRQRSGQWPMGWVLEDECGKIVGSIGNIPLACQFRGRELRAATTCAWAVDPGYRSCSLLILDRVVRQQSVDLLVFTSVSPSAEPAFNAFQFSRVPVGAWDESAFWITNYHGFSRSALSRRSFPWAAVGSYPASAALFCLDKFRGDGIGLPRSSCEIELCSRFDSRFDVFWEELRRQKRNVLLAVRTRETLAWHFRRALRKGSVWILAASHGARITGYAICDRQDNAALGLKRVRLVDFQALDGSEDVLRSALGWVLRRCREEGIHLLEVTGCWLNWACGPRIRVPYSRPMPSWAYYYKANDQHLREALKDPAVWAPSSFDGDASL